MRPTLRSARQFEAVYNRGRKSVCAVLVLFQLEAPDARVAYVASRKVGGAIARNRAKRVMRAGLREAEKRLGRTVPGWMILVARRDILPLTSTEVAAQLLPLLATTPAGAVDSGASERRTTT